MTRKTREAARAAEQRRFARVRLLDEEMDRLKDDVDLRAASVANRGSFLAVAAGILIAAAVGKTWTVLPIAGVLALAFACVGLLCATVALRPARRAGLIARRLADLYIDSQQSAAEVEIGLVRQKADAIALREGDLVARARWVAAGLTSLVVSVAMLTIVFATQLLGG